MGKENTEDIAVLDRVAREGLIKKATLEQRPKEVKNQNLPHRCEGRVLITEGTVDSKSLR